MKLSLRNILIAVAIVLSLWIVVGVARAQDVPLTPDHTCLYADSAQPGQGLELRVLPATESEPARVVGNLFVGQIAQWFRYAPSWFSIQGPLQDGDGVSQTFDLFNIGGVTFGGNAPVAAARAGSIRLTAIGPGALVAEARLDAQSGFSPPDPVISVTFAFRCLVR